MRSRILRATFAAVVCAMLLFAIPLAVAAFQLYQQDEVRELERLAEHVAVMVPAEVHSARDAMVLPPTESDTRLGVYDTAAHRVWGAGPATGDAPVTAALQGRISSLNHGQDLVVAVPVGSGDQVRAAVRASAHASDPLRRAVITWLGMLALAMLALAVAALVAIRSSQRLARPLEVLASIAGRLGSGDFSARAPGSAVPEIDAVGGVLNRAAERIAGLLERERAFSADASHQLRTALAGVRLELDSALQRHEIDPYAAMRAAMESVDRMEHTVVDLLALARDMPVRGHLDIAAVLAEVERRWRGELAAAGRPLRVVVDEDLPEAVGSSAAARQVLDVLVANAATHGRGEVLVRVRDAAGVPAIDVEDEGSGIPEGLEVFDRRCPGALGHGIGLALARSLAEAEGGRLLLARRSPHPRFTWLIATPPPGQDEPALVGA